MQLIEKVAARRTYRTKALTGLGRGRGTRALSGLGIGGLAAVGGGIAAYNLLTGRGRKQSERALRIKEKEVEKLKKSLGKS